MPPTTEAAPAPSVPVNSAPPVPVADEDRQPRPLPLSPRRTAPPAPGPLSRVLILRAYGAQMAVSTPTNGGLCLTAGGPSVVLGLHAVWTLPKGLRLRPRLDYTVFAGEARSSTAAPLPQRLDTRVSSLALGVDLLVPISNRWSLGLEVAETRWSVASTNTVTPTLGGNMTLSGTSHWVRLAYGPVLTFKVKEHLEVEARALNSHYGYQNQPATTAAVGLLWRF